MKLNVASDFSLPLEAVTQTFATLAKRGAGKTYLSSVLAEEMLAAGQQIVALDPTGAWWGLRSGFPIAVLGGEHGDVPLQESAGEVIAQAIVEHRFPAVLDLSLFRKGQMIRFMVGFLETLYRLNRDPVHLFVDEADAFAPQGRNFGGEENRMLGAMEDLVRRGRKRGIGCTLITQRPAVLNKNVLTQCESVFALRMVHPRDIGALKEWIDVHADPQEAKDVIASLPSLPIGEAWFWSPGWMGALKRIHVRKRETFDSSATPKPGEETKRPKSLAKLDLAALGEKIKAAADQAKDNDPRELKRRIADLQRQLRERPAETVVETKIERVEVPVLKNGQLDKAHKLVDRLEAASTAAVSVARELAGVIGSRLAAAPPRPAPTLPRPAPNIPRPASVPRPSTVPRPAPASQVGELAISRAQQRILDALAWYESLGTQEPSLVQVGAVALIDTTGGYFSNVVGPLSAAGLVERPSGKLRLTDAGRALANQPESVASLDQYHDVLRNRVRKMKSASGKTIEILDAIIAAGGGELTVEQIGEAVRVDHTGGYFSNCIGPLGTAGLIERDRGVVKPTHVLFPEALV